MLILPMHSSLPAVNVAKENITLKSISQILQNFVAIVTNLLVSIEFIKKNIIKKGASWGNVCKRFQVPF